MKFQFPDGQTGAAGEKTMEPIKLNIQNRADEPQGPMCRLDAKPAVGVKAALVNSGAVSSAFMGFLI